MRLTAREIEVLNGLAEGKTTKGHALELGLSESTVRTHRSKLYRKLGVVNAAQAVVAAYRLLGR